MLLHLVLLAASPAMIAVDEPMPPLEGEFLTGARATLPAAARGRVALLGLGFTYNSRWAVETWIKSWNIEFKNEPRATFYEVPMLGSMARLGRWFIDSGMRKGTPKESHENVVTVYSGTGPWKDRVGFSSSGEDDAYLILLDSRGVVRWRHHGVFDTDQFHQLARIAHGLLASDHSTK